MDSLNKFLDTAQNFAQHKVLAPAAGVTTAGIVEAVTPHPGLGTLILQAVCALPGIITAVGHFVSIFKKRKS